MTTLKSFQAEIEQISSDKHKQAIKEAREAFANAELAKHHGRATTVKTVEENVDDMEIGGEVKDVSMEVNERCCAMADGVGPHCFRWRH